jgi:hypothetical protein
MRTGVVLTTNLEPHARIEPHLGATVDVGGKVMFVIARDGTLRTYSYPECKPLTRRRLAMAAYGVVFDAKAGKLWVAGFDPASVALDPRARSFGVIHGYSVK